QAAAQAAQAQINGVSSSQQSPTLQQQQQQQQQQQPILSQPVQQSALLPEQTQQSSPIPITDANMLNMSSSGTPIATPQPQDGRTLSQQASINNLANNGNNAGNAVTLTPGQQLQLKKQQLLNKYQQIMTMSEQFKKNMSLIKTRLNEPNLDESTKADLLEKEHEVQTRLDYCKRCTQQIATQLKLAQQQAQQLQQSRNNQANSPQVQILGGIPNQNLASVPSAQTLTPGYMSTGATPVSASHINGDLPNNSSNLNLNAAAATPATAPVATPATKAKSTTKKAATKKQTKADSKKTANAKANANANSNGSQNASVNPEENPNKKQKTAASATPVTTGALPTVTSAATTATTNATAASAPASASSVKATKPDAAVQSAVSGNDTSERAKFQNLNIPEDLKIRSQDPVAVKVNNRPSILGGNAIAAPALTNPVMIKPEQFELEGERVLNKRKLKELVASVASEEGETEINIDGDVEELLLDLADEFVSSVTSFASRLARHRHSENLDVRDVQLHLERNWNIRIPGYAADEIRMIRKFAPNNVHTSKINGVFINKSVDKAP
ncbi:Transcription initiation factor TFIID subunit 12, partial [Pichia californica]